VAWIIGPFYLWILTGVFSHVTDTRYAVTLAIVAAGAAVLMTCIALFGVRAYRGAGRSRQFRISSLLLAMVPLSVYLAAIRWVLSGSQTAEFTPGQWFAVVLVACVFILLSTLILAKFAEAIVWTAVALVRVLSYLRSEQRRQETND
jgi:hypothetical protein